MTDKYILTIDGGKENAFTKEYTREELEAKKDYIAQTYAGRYRVDAIGAADTSSIDDNASYTVKFNDSDFSKTYTGAEFKAKRDYLEQNYAGRYDVETSVGSWDDMSQVFAPSLREQLDTFRMENRDFMNDIENRIDTNIQAARMGGGGTAAAFGRQADSLEVTDEDWTRYNELVKQEEELKRAYYTSDEYLKEQNEKAYMMAQMRDQISKDRLAYAQAHPMLATQHTATRGAEADAEMQMFETAGRIMDDAIKLQNAPSRYTPKGTGFRNMRKGAGDKASDIDLWTAGLSEITDNLGVRGVLSKVQAKLGNLNDLSEETIESILTPAEKAVLQAWAINAQTQMARAEDLSRGYQAGQGAVESLAFMAEFALTGGVGKAASEGAETFAKWLGKKVTGSADEIVEEAAKEVAEKAGEGILKKYGKNLGLSLAEAAGRTGVMPSTFRNISEKATEINEDEDGNRTLVSMNNAFAKGLADSFIENLSEGGRVSALGSLVGDVAGKIPAYAKLTHWLSNTKAADIYNAFQSSGIMNSLRAGGWHGIFEEYLEEWYGNALRTLTHVDRDALKDFATVDNQLVTITSFLPLTIFGGTVSTAQVMKSRKQLSKALDMLKTALMDRAYSEEQANEQIDMLMGATPQQVSDYLTPIINQEEEANEEAGSKMATVAANFTKALVKWQSYNTKYRYQEQEQRDAVRANLLQATGGKSFWMTDEDGNETVQRATNDKGEVVFVTSKPTAEDRRVSGVTPDGRIVFFNDGEFQLENEKTMNDFLHGEVMAEKADKEKARMLEEKDAAIREIKAASAPGAQVTLGTVEAPIPGIIRQRLADGVIIETPEGIQHMTYEQLGNYIGINATPMTDEQIDEQQSDTMLAEDAQREAELDMEYDDVAAAEVHEEETIAEVESALKDDKPLPLDSEGEVDEEALWNEDPGRWAAWNDERKQDGGNDSFGALFHAKEVLEEEIAKMEKAYKLTFVGKKRNVLAQEIEAKKQRLAFMEELVDEYASKVERLLMEKYAAEERAKAAQEAPAQEQAALSVSQAQMTEQQMDEMDAQYEGIYSQTRSLNERARLLQEYLDKISEGTIPVKVLTEANYAQVMADAGCSKYVIQQIKVAIDNGSLIEGFMAAGKAFIFANNIPTIDKGREKYVHERQHVLTRNSDYVSRILATGVTKEQLKKYLRILSQGNFYDEYPIDVMADEFLSFAMELVYTFEDFSVSLQNIGVSESLINVIKTIDDEQSGATNGVRLSQARRRRRLYPHVSATSAGSGGQNARDTEKVSRGILDEQGSRPSTDSQRGAGDREGGEGAAEPAVDDEINPAFVEAISTDAEDAEWSQAMDDKAFATPPAVDGIEADDVRHSIALEGQMRESTQAYYDKHYKGGKLSKTDQKRVPLNLTHFTQELLDTANAMIEEMRQYMLPYLDMESKGKRFLPAEVYGQSTLFDNASYGKTMENTLICTRTLAYIDFVEEVKKRIGRPLTATESFLASQMLYDIAVDPQCLYCYVSLDRKAYDEFLLRYAQQRDEVIAKWNASDKSEEAKEAIYKEFLDGRKPTAQMKARFESWLLVAEGNDAITLEDLATKARRGQLRMADMPEAWAKASQKYKKLKKDKKLEYAASEEYQNALWEFLASPAGQVADAEAYAQSASWAKKEEDYRSYTGELLKCSADALKGLMGHYGLRFYSFSEYSPAFILENMQMVRDAAARGLKGFAYTKEIDFIRIFAPTGMNINCSVYGRVDSEGNVVPDTKQGADWAQVQELREQYPNVGAVFVATNDSMVEWALNQPWIDVIIPFHIVRTGADIAKFYEWTNYSSMQSDTTDEGKSGYVYPHEHLNDKETFLRITAERGWKPRFEDVKLSDGRSIVEHPNYMRLVNETRRRADETPILTPVFNLEAAKDSFDRFVEKGGYYSGYFVEDGAFEEGIETVVEDIKAGKTAKEVNYGRQDVPIDVAKIMAKRAELERKHRKNPDMLAYAQESLALHEAQQAAEGEDVRFSAKLTDREIDNLVKAMKANAEVAEDLELTPENWEDQFGTDGMVPTPVGNVKMGENQYLKLLQRKRSQYFGMIRPTLVNPDIVLEELSPSENGERDTVLLFIKTFIKPDGSRYVHFESVTIQKDSMEISISSHEIQEEDLKKKMRNDNVAHLRDSLSASEVRLNGRPSDGSDLVPTPSDNLSDSKDSENLETPSDSARFSVITPQMDADYLAAVERGDMETAQRMVNEAAEAAGYAQKVYRVDAYEGDKTRYKNVQGGVFYAESLDYFDHSDTGHRRADAKPFFLNTTGFFDPMNEMRNLIVNSWGDILGRESDFEKFGIEDETFDDRGQYNDGEEILVTSTDGLAYAAQKQGYNGVILRDIPQNDGRAFTEYAAYNSNSVKSADPVTYDDNGNVIPLSERFNPENEDIRFSARTDEQREALFDKAKAQFGLTNNFKVAGYMLPDGSLLDFSEANDGGDPNQRTLDHREIEGIIMDEGREYDSRWMYLADFMNEGAIRLLPEYAGINLMKAPTKEQRSRLFDFIYKYNGEVILEIADERLNNVAYVEYDRRTSPSRIFRDIDGYFNEGIVPQQDVRFSVRESSMDEMDSLFKEYNNDETLSALYDKVSALAHTMGLKIKFDNPWSNAAGTTVADKVKFNSMFMDSPYQPAEKKAHAILHELIHATTQYAIQAKKAGLLTEDMTEAVNHLDNIYNEIKADPAFEGMKGAESVHEMVAELANPEFRATLKEKNLFQQIVDAIKRLLGIETGENALDNLSSTLDYILENFDADAYRKYVDVAQRNEGYIRFSIANENQAIFVSNAARAVEGIRMEKATPAQWLAMIEKNGGLKAGEDKWMGLSDWLKASDKKTLTKAEVLEFINEHMIQIEEVHYDAYAEEKVADAYAEMGRILQDKFNAYREEYYEQNEDEDLYGNPANDYAIERLREELGDEFPYAIEVTGAGDVYLTFPYEEDEDMRKWSEKLGVEYDPQAQIENIRLGYTTDGLTNKSEIALTVPTIEPWGEEDITHFGDAGDGRAVAWVRFGETTDESGNKVLVIDEIQSKRHQEGREKGYRETDIRPLIEERERIKREWIAHQNKLKEKFNAAKDKGERYEFTEEDIDTRDALDAQLYDIEAKIKEQDSKIPDAPFDKNWHELAMKRMLRYAAENGYDVIAWTKGEQQAERYNLGEIVSSISYILSKDGSTYHVYPRDKAGLIPRSIPTEFNSKEAIADVYGKEIATKIVEDLSSHQREVDNVNAQLEATLEELRAAKDPKGKEEISDRYLDLVNARDRLMRAEFSIEGEDLHIGGEGMKGFYDKMLPAFMNKYGKKWGVKVADITLPNVEEAGRVMHSVPVTEEMKASVMEEQVMFSAAQIDPAVRQEMDTIKAKAMWDGTFMKAPNGADTNLTEEQWLMVRTKNFINWFGDWINDPENASKVVDENGEPMVVYHGTNEEFNVFGESASRFGARGKIFGDGYYFSSSKEVAEEYANRYQAAIINGERIPVTIRRVMPVFLNIVDMIDIKSLADWKAEFQMQRVRIWNEKSKTADGLVVRSIKDGSNISADTYLIYDSANIKSATETTGLFSESGDIRFSVGDFGEIYEQFRGKPKEAIAFLMEKQSGEAVGALYHPEIGEIDLVWGEAGTGKSDGYGLAKLVKFHPEVIDNLQEILSEMQIVKQSANRVNLESDKYQAAVRLTWNNKAKKWLLTAFEKKNSVLDNTTDTGETSKGSKQNDTATLQDTVSDSKDSDNIENSNTEDNISFDVNTTPTDEIVAEGMKFSVQDFARLAGNIFQDMPESFRKEAIEETFKRGWDMQSAIFQTSASLAKKENWDETDKEFAQVIRDKVQDAMDESGVVMSRPLTDKEALWMLYRSTGANTDSMLDAAKRSMVAYNLGFDKETLAREDEAKEDVRFSAVRSAKADATARLYNKSATFWWSRIKESLVDMYASVEGLVKAMEETSGKAAQGFENVLMALNQQSSKGLAAMEKYTKKYLEPMLDAISAVMKAAGKTYDDVVRYVILKHGLERNEAFAKRDAKEYWTNFFGRVDSYMKSKSHAQLVVALSEAKAKVKELEEAIMLGETGKEQALIDAQTELQIVELALRGDEKQNEADLDAKMEAIDNGADAKYKEFRKNDYSGITSMFYDQLEVNRSDFDTEEEYQKAIVAARTEKFKTLKQVEDAAAKEVEEFEDAANTDRLWKKINAGTKEILRQQYEASMISKEQYDTLREMFKFYVPLRGFKDNTAEDMYTYYRKPNSTGYIKPILAAEGRKTEAESPFGWIASMASSAIASNVKNEARLALYYFVANRPDNGLATLSKTWYKYSHTDLNSGKRVFVPAYPEGLTPDMTAEEAKKAIDAWHEEMEQARKEGKAYESGQKLSLGDSVVNIEEKNRPEHAVNVKVNGKDYTIFINGNPRAAQAINGDLNVETQGDYSKVFGPLLRWMSSVNTSYNPEFWVTNMQRDFLFTVMAVSTKEDPAYRRRFAANYMKAFKVISMAAKNEEGLLGDSEIEALYKEFVDNGGVTGYTQIKDNETWEQEIANYMKSQDLEDQKMGAALKKMRDGFHALHRFGESLEQVSRFAAFMTSRQMGRSMQESINDAKEITVNFNRKGSGKWISPEEAKTLTDRKGRPLNEFQRWIAVGLTAIAPAGRRFIMFFNAAIQGLNATVKLYRKNPDKMFLLWTLGYFSLGVMQAMLHDLWDDDDDYLDMPQYERRNSLMLGGNGFYFKWALPQEARMFYALGDLFVEEMLGRNPQKAFDEGSTLGQAITAVTEILPINPFEGWRGILPSVAVPYVELVANEDYKGTPIYNEQKWAGDDEADRTAKWSRAYEGTGTLYVGLSRLLNAMTGGDKHDAGFINLQPEKLEHIVQSSFGGTLRTIDKFVSTILAAVDQYLPGEADEKITMRQAPFLNRLFTINDERFKNAHVNELYGYYAAEAEHVMKLRKNYIKDKEKAKKEALDKTEEAKWVPIYKKYKKPIEKKQEQIRMAKSGPERQRLMKEQDVLKKRMIKEISEIR